METSLSPGDPALERRRAIARGVSDAFVGKPDVAAVLVFGSVAHGHVDERSDVDLLVVCKDQLLALPNRAPILAGLGTGWLSTDNSTDHPLWPRLFAAEDAKGLVGGIAVDLHYQRASWIDNVLSQVITDGAITTPQLPFRPYTLAGLLQRSWVLWDTYGLVADWKQRIAVYPPALSRNVVHHFSPLLKEYVEDMVDGAERALGPNHFIFFLGRAVDAMVSILLALNDTYDPADKRAAKTILPTLPRVPRGFATTLNDVLEGPFDDAGARYRARLFRELVDDVLTQAWRDDR